MEWVKSRTSKHKQLGGLDFVDQIAKNASGKMLKRVYRDMFKKQKESEAVKARL
jgi:acyl-coenzyme A synthetase/AMP-(fatty) acid ligase